MKKPAKAGRAKDEIDEEDEYGEDADREGADQGGCQEAGGRSL